MKYIIKICLIFVSFVPCAYAATSVAQRVILPTARGAVIGLDIYNPGLPKVLLLAPGAGCGSQKDMYRALADAGQSKGFTLVRLIWAYCLTPPEGRPSPDFIAEKEDLQAALGYTTKTLGFAEGEIYLGGKSIGSRISFQIFQENKFLPGVVLLTPLCTSYKDPLTLKNKFSDNYPGMDLEKRPVFLIQGNADPYCLTNHFQDYLKGKPNNFISLVTTGDHSFAIKNPQGENDRDLTLKNQHTIAHWLFGWLPGSPSQF